MAKKKKAKPMAVHDRVALHASMSEQLATLISRCDHLRDTGKTAEALRMLERIERMAKELAELEKW